MRRARVACCEREVVGRELRTLRSCHELQSERGTAARLTPRLTAAPPSWRGSPWSVSSMDGLGKLH